MEYDLTSIKGSSNWLCMKEINKGWSSDKKYLVETKAGEKYLLRLSDKSSFSSEKMLYDLVEELSQSELRISKLVDSGICNHGETTYRLFSWVEGVELLEVIAHLSPQEQYRLGLEAGQIQKVVHQKTNAASQRNWEAYFNRKIDRNIRNYQNCGERFAYDHCVIDFLNKYRKWLRNRPQSLHHGDFHIGNMLVNQEGHLFVIDFNRLDYGDPWEEFNRMPWNATVSKPFSIGLLHGYLDGEPSESFFQLMGLYIASNQLGGYAWAKNYGAKELEVMKSQTKQVMAWYDNFREIIPNWYQSNDTYKEIRTT